MTTTSAFFYEATTSTRRRVAVLRFRYVDRAVAASIATGSIFVCASSTTATPESVWCGVWGGLRLVDVGAFLVSGTDVTSPPTPDASFVEALRISYEVVASEMTLIAGCVILAARGGGGNEGFVAAWTASVAWYVVAWAFLACVVVENLRERRRRGRRSIPKTTNVVHFPTSSSTRES